jgi:hypothetical protein
MKKIFLLFILINTFSFATKGQTGWVKQKFGDKLTISFPTEAKKANETTYVARDSAGTVYGVVIMEIDQSAYTTTLSSDTALVRLKFIDEVVGSVKAKMPKYAIGDLKISEVNNTKTYSLNGKNEENQSTVHLNIFLIGDVSYSLTCFSPAGVDGKNKDAFLNSFVIAK